MKKEEITITFYAAECGEFHEMGEYTKCNSLEEAYKKYRKYCKTSGNMCPAIEFSIQTLFTRIWNIRCHYLRKTGNCWSLCHTTMSIHW